MPTPTAPVSPAVGIETWKPVVGYEAKYEVSDLGRVRRSAPGINTYVGRVLGETIDRGGYVRVILTSGSPRKGKVRLVHQLVMAAFVGPCPPGHEINHKHPDKTNNRLENLEYVTKSQNVQHAAANGLYANRQLVGAAAVHAARTHCKNGHPLEQGKTQRRCPVCRREQQAQWARDKRRGLR